MPSKNKRIKRSLRVRVTPKDTGLSALKWFHEETMKKDNLIKFPSLKQRLDSVKREIGRVAISATR